eukprot:gene824-biopygen6175
MEKAKNRGAEGAAGKNGYELGNVSLRVRTASGKHRERRGETAAVWRGAPSGRAPQRGSGARARARAARGGAPPKTGLQAVQQPAAVRQQVQGAREGLWSFGANDGGFQDVFSRGSARKFTASANTCARHQGGVPLLVCDLFSAGSGNQN